MRAARTTQDRPGRRQAIAAAWGTTFAARIAQGAPGRAWGAP